MDIQVTESLDETQRAQWHAFLAKAEHSHPEQDPRFADGWRARGDGILYAMGWEGGNLRAVAVFNVARGGVLLGLSPTATAVSGPVCDDPRDMLAFLDLLEQHEAFNRVLKLKVTPYWLAPRAADLSATFEEAGWAPFEEDYLRTTGIHDTTGTADDIASRFNRSARRKLRKAREFGLEAEFVSDEATAREAFEVYNRHFEARYGGTVDEQSFMSDFRNVYATGDLGALFVVRHEGAMVAGCVIHRSRATVFLRHSFIDDAAAVRLGNIRVAPLITMEALKWGNERGCRYADENGYIHGLDESHPLFRVYKYKEDFRPTEVQRLPGHQKVLRPAIEKSLQIAEKAKEGVKPYVKTLRNWLRGSAARSGVGTRGVGPQSVGSASFWQRIRAARIPLGLTLGGAAVWLLSSLFA